MAQYVFDRPISHVFNACFDAGFVLDGIEEPTFPERTPARAAVHWGYFTDIPPALVARMRLLGDK